MNCKQFNTVALDEILNLLGHHPSKENEKEARYINPFQVKKQLLLSMIDLETSGIYSQKQ